MGDLLSLSQDFPLNFDSPTSLYVSFAGFMNKTLKFSKILTWRKSPLTHKLAHLSCQSCVLLVHYSSSTVFLFSACLIILHFFNLAFSWHEF